MNRHRPTIRHAIPVFSLLFLALLPSGRAQTRGAAPPPGAGTTFRAEVAAREAVDRAGEPRAFDALLRLGAFRYPLDPAAYRALLDRVIAARNPHPSVRVLGAYMDALAVWREQGVGAARARFAAQGFVVPWRVVGPFDNEGRSGIATVYPPESDPVGPETLGRTYAGKERDVAWLPASAPFGRLRFDRYLYPMVNTCQYALTVLRAGAPADARVWAGSDGSLAVWVGGRPAIRSDAYYGAHPDRFAADVRLPRGDVPLLVKTCGDGGTRSVYVRVTDRSGRPLRGVSAVDPADMGTPVPPAADPATWETAIQALLRAAAEGSAEDKRIAGRALDLSGMIDRTDNEAERLLEQAAREDPGVESFLWLASAATDTVKAASAAATLAALAGDDPYLLATAASRRLRTIGLRAADAPSRRALEVPGGADDPLAVTTRASILQSRGMEAACTRLLERWLESHAPSSSALYALRSCLQAEGRVDEAATVLDRIEAMDRYDPTPASERMQLCALRGEVDGVRAAGAALLDAYPEDLATALKVASALFTAGAGEDALVLLHRLADEAPHHPRVTESLGRTLEALERRDEAIAMYRRTVDLEPQNQPLARYVEFLEERDGLERRWAVEFDAEASGATAARAELAAMSAADREKLRRGRALFRQEVDLIHPNGLSSRMGQSFTLVQTEDGAEQFRQTQVPFTPGEEDFELLRAVVHKPDGHRQDYEVHYPVSFGGGSYFSDMGAEFVAFPRLGVGDVVELRYRIDNRSRRNKFGEHYSREVWVLNTNPTDRFRYVLTAPEDKVLRIHVPDGFTPRVTESREDGMHTRIYELTGLPAIPEEPNAPPMGELARPIELTTFADWAELGRWWWNLAREQLLPDEAIRRRVAEITDGADGVEEKVYRIFDWAIRNTRYVALEFGIHGWKPYRANEVISRGFGDCKDKAGLLYTMLAAAGIDSRMVLLRTRHYSGFPTSDHPSLGQFDHAILYVPGLDLFLDGTVTQAAATELPVMDRQAMALVVGPDGVDRVTTPLEPRSPDRSEADFDFTIDAGGDATLSAALTTRGHYASGLRGRLEAAETRRQRTEEMLNGDFPGLSLATLDVQGLEDFRLPVSATLTASVPDLAVGTGGRFSLRIGRGGGLARRLAAAATRELDVEIYSPIREHRSFRYRLPEGAAEIEIPRSIEARDGDRLFRIETRLEGREVHVTVELAIPDTRIPRAQYAAFRTFLAAVDTATSEPITYAMP